MDGYTLELETADFRRYAPVEATDARGERIWLVLCEELLEGRWEPFLATYRTRPSH